MENLTLLLNPVKALQLKHFHVISYGNFLIIKL